MRDTNRQTDTYSIAGFKLKQLQLKTNHTIQSNTDKFHLSDLQTYFFPSVQSYRNVFLLKYHHTDMFLSCSGVILTNMFLSNSNIHRQSYSHTYRSFPQRQTHRHTAGYYLCHDCTNMKQDIPGSYSSNIQYMLLSAHSYSIL